MESTPAEITCTQRKLGAISRSGNTLSVKSTSTSSHTSGGISVAEWAWWTITFSVGETARMRWTSSSSVFSVINTVTGLSMQQFSSV